MGFQLCNPNLGVMTSPDCETVFAEEIKALHKSLEQLNAESIGTKCQDPNEELSTIKTASNSARKRIKTKVLVDVETQTPKKARKKHETVSEQEMFQLDHQIDQVLEEVALKRKLTRPNVKNMLRNIITNENVVQMLKCSLDSNSAMPFEPKLTRSKTREWLETQNISWKPQLNTSDTCVLMEGELSEDSDDDEYRPNEEETDEESFISSQTSDIGSPSSSLPPLITKEQSLDEIFKKPLPITSFEENSDLIGFRTRSKLPLNDTPLEHLEMAFVPPDISTDMYESDCDEEEWRKFLKEFVCPPQHHLNEFNDDEDADPEYNILEDEEEFDAEELRADRTVQITKKEVSELLSELFEEDFSSTEDEVTLKNLPAPTDDILQSAYDAIDELQLPVSPGLNKYSKPTGIVLPTPVTPAPSSDQTITINFPTLNFAPIELKCDPYIPAHEQQGDSMNIFSSGELKLILEEQMRKHVQLLTQMHLITAQQSELSWVTKQCRNMLLDLTAVSSVDIANLSEAVELTEHWETAVINFPSKDYRPYQRTIVSNGNKKQFVKRYNRHPDRYPFNPKMVELMAGSKVFIYPELLPKLACFEVESGPCRPSIYEEQLIAMGMEQFTPYCREMLSDRASQHSVKKLVSSMISHYMLPHWSERQIDMRIDRLSHLHKENPIKYYRMNLKAPPVVHHLQPFDAYSVPKLSDVCLKLLPSRWRELIMLQVGINHAKSISNPGDEILDNSSNVLGVSRNKRKQEPIKKNKKRPSRLPYPQVNSDSNQQTEPIRHRRDEPIDSPLNNQHLSNSSINKINCAHQLNLDEMGPAFRHIPLNSSEQDIHSEMLDRISDQVNAISEELSVAPETAISPVKEFCKERGVTEEIIPFLKEEKDDEGNDSQSSTSENGNNSTMGNTQPFKRYVLIERLNGNAAHVMHVWGPTMTDPIIPVRRVADDQNQRTSDTHSCQDNSSGTSSKGVGIVSFGDVTAGERATSGSGGDDGEDGSKRPIPNTHSESTNEVTAEDDEEEDTVPLNRLRITASSSQPAVAKGRSPAHRQVRNQRNARRILDTWMVDDNPMDSPNDAFARVYISKVREQLGHQESAAYIEFASVLCELHSPSGSIQETYKKMEKILSPELMEEFVIFLTPEQAALCGKEFQYFLLVRMREFFSKLKIHFKDNVTQLKRVLKTLQQIQSSSSATINDIKTAVLPLLKGNLHLTQCFLQLFLDDPPPPSDASEFEEVNMDRTNSGDEFEYVDYNEAGGPSKEMEGKPGKRVTSKGNSKGRNKGKSWKK